MTRLDAEVLPDHPHDLSRAFKNKTQSVITQERYQRQQSRRVRYCNMSKVKRPEKMQPSMGLNGVNGGAPSVSTSPSLPAKKPPPILPPTSGTSNGGTVNGISRTAARPRRDAPSQLLGRGQRTAGAGLKSASMVADMQVVQASQPPPYSNGLCPDCRSAPLTMSSSIRQLYLKEVSRVPCVAHRPSPPHALPIRPAGWHVLLQVSHEDFHRTSEIRDGAARSIGILHDVEHHFLRGYVAAPEWHSTDD